MLNDLTTAGDGRHPLQAILLWSWVAGSVIVLSALAGCSSDQLETAEVHGTVTLDGNPLTNAQVLFSPARGRGARGSLGSDGTFTLTTYSKGDGAIVGLHQVSILPVTPLNATTAEAESSSQIEIPVRYTVGATSGLTADVKPNQLNRADFNLSSR